MAVAEATDLGSRVRTEREARGWSLAELAAASGVSKAMISRIERGESSPTAALLGKLSGGFRLSMSTLVARAETDWVDPETGYERHAVATTQEFPVDITEVRLPPGARVEFPASAYAFTRHVIWISEGTLSFTEGEVRHTLWPGSSLQLGEPADCVFENRGTVACRYLVIVATDR